MGLPRAGECMIHTELARRAFSVAAASIRNSLYTCWHSTVRKHSHFQTPLENPSVQTHLVLLCCLKHLCVFGPKGAIRIRYYYYYYLYLYFILYTLYFIFIIFLIIIIIIIIIIFIIIIIIIIIC